MEKNNYQIEKKNIPGFIIREKKIDGYMYHNKSMGLLVIQSISREEDGRLWIHTSFSRRSRIPTYQDITFIKKNFIGDEQKAVMVFPEKEHYINIHPYCLHLFHCLNRNPLPNFDHNTRSL